MQWIPHSYWCFGMNLNIYVFTPLLHSIQRKHFYWDLFTFVAKNDQKGLLPCYSAKVPTSECPLIVCSMVSYTEPQHPSDGDDCGAFPACESRVFINSKPGKLASLVKALLSTESPFILLNVEKIQPFSLFSSSLILVNILLRVWSNIIWDSDIFS